MRWYVHGNLTPAAVAAIVRHGHTAQSASDVFGDAAPAQANLLKELHARQLDLITADKSIVQQRFDTAQPFSRSIVFLQLTGGDVEQDDAIDRLFARYKSPKPGLLYTVTETRVKVRQLPGL
jgi:hypothetical protein